MNTTALAWIVGIVVSVSILWWLDSGCTTVGVVTWRGVVCAEDL